MEDMIMNVSIHQPLVNNVHVLNDIKTVVVHVGKDRYKGADLFFYNVNDLASFIEDLNNKLADVLEALAA